MKITYRRALKDKHNFKFNQGFPANKFKNTSENA